ncbi:MAG TPA: hypothetical protein PKY55_13120 [bacterium]|nr:hypothetical protein [bacterium]
MDPILAKINPPPLVYYHSIEEYRQHYIAKYAKNAILTFDYIAVHFSIDQFEHAFYRASIPKVTHKDLFDQDRAERINWIEYTLCSGLAEVYLKREDERRRLHILLDNYVVVINLARKNPRNAFFITAYVADSEAHIEKLKTHKLLFKP